MATMAQEMEEKVVKDEKKAWPVKLIVTHVRPHFDEVLAIFMLKTWGNEFFPGVEDADVEAWSEGKMPAEYRDAGKTADDFLQQNQVLAVGTCGGMFDEHGKDSPTCTHLVADYLGIAKKPELQKMLAFCKRVDNEGNSMPFDLHSIMKDMYDLHGDDNEGLQIVIDWALAAISAYVNGQAMFFRCESEFARVGNIIEGPIRIAIVQSDNSKMNKWIRWKFNSPEVIIQRRSSGHTVILTTSKIGIDMRDVARIVRLKELQKRKISIPKWQILEAYGPSNECTWWYFYEQGQQLLNGSLTSLEVEPTVLSLLDVAGVVALSCASHIDECKDEECYGHRCEKYHLGLIACRRKRYTVQK